MFGSNNFFDLKLRTLHPGAEFQIKLLLFLNPPKVALSIILGSL